MQAHVVAAGQVVTGQGQVERDVDAGGILGFGVSDGLVGAEN